MSHIYKYQIAHSSKPTRSSIKNYDTFEEKLNLLLTKKQITNEQDYNATLKEIKKLSELLKVPAITSAIFRQELALIRKKKPLTEPTHWGGVALKKVDVEKDFIQKLLIIKKLGVLGFEIHKKKHEHLKILEGYCLVFWVNRNGKPNTTISVQLAGPKDEFTFQPKIEHGILTITNTIIEETSTNHLDDLVYLYPAHL